MSTDTVAILGFVALFALMLLRVPVGMAMGLVGVTGFGYLNGFSPALKLVGQTSMRTVTDYTFGVVPSSLLGYLRPGCLPRATPTSRRERFAGLKNIWAPVFWFVCVIGGLSGLPSLPRFTPTEAGGVGATGAFLIGVFTGRLAKEKILTSLLQATRTAAAVFTVLIGALIFGYFLTVTQTPQKVTEFLT